MTRRVGIVSVAQGAGVESKDNFYDQAYRITKEVLEKAGITRDDLGTIVTALVMALCKGSENPPNDTCTLMFADPFYQRPVGLQETLAAALQMRLYLERYGITEEQCAEVAVKNLENALGNPYAHRKGRYTVEEILGSERRPPRWSSPAGGRRPIISRCWERPSPKNRGVTTSLPPRSNTMR